MSKWYATYRLRGAARVLIKQNRRADADVVLQFGLSIQPTHYGLLVDHAWNAQRDGRLSDALARWMAVWKEKRRNPRIPCRIARLSRELGQFDHASEVIGEAQRLFPNNAAVLGEAARIAEMRGDWAASERLWRRAVDRPIASASTMSAYAQTLFVLSRFDEFDQFMKSAPRRHRRHRGFLALQAMRTASQQRWDEALALWSEFRRRYPRDKMGWEHYGRTLHARDLALADGKVGEPDASAAAGPVAPQKIEVVADEDARSLLLGFESLGENCEFGLVQRRFGAEPLGLLRFNNVQLGSLLTALASQFQDMGEPATTEMVPFMNEYFIQDRRWGLAMHTFLFVGQQDPDVLYKKLCRRIAYLKDKLLSDLAEGRKVFVFTGQSLTMDGLRALHAALETFGPVKLLHTRVVTADAAGFPDGRAGEVVSIDRGLFVGYLRRPGVTAGNDWDIAFEDWLAICRKVRSLVDASSVAAAA
ncbi:lipopolysaccharide assembly protein LapB [Reyranella sp. CPCC 100927]|uniref:tetratricopeptide repeat protein n=1 Tax=Reyranella sp. CPCC 100927 TaxID=2599616 RepID=UPI0011B66C9D|nr:hypothetical protein [Reyranella sp. CPCC 100927]TWS98263.1 hypothetical protein FQU96_36145 [Reyranella sp. CPCC 100927]